MNSWRKGDQDLCKRTRIYEFIDAYVQVRVYIFTYIKCNSLIRIYPRVTMIMRPSILNRVTHGNNSRPIIRSNRGQSSFW